MNVIKRLLLLLAVCLTTTSVVRAQATEAPNVEILLGMCKSSEASTDHWYCVGFIMGIADMMEQVGIQQKGQFQLLFGMCVSKPFPDGNAEVQAFINWAEKSPKEWGKNYMFGVVAAMSQTWPCDPISVLKQH